MKKNSLLFVLLMTCLTQGLTQVIDTQISTPATGGSSNCCNTASSNSANDAYCPPNTANFGAWSTDIRDRNQYDEVKYINHSYNKKTVYVSADAPPIKNLPQAVYEQLITNASQAFLNRNFAKCIDLCDAILQLNRNDSEAYYLKGVAHYAINKTDIAIKFLQIAEAKGSRNAGDALRMFGR